MAVKLLFADDSVTMQKVIQLTLENENVDLIFASDGNRAWELARDKHPDIVVADVFMPGLDGFQLCEKLKKNPDTSAIPVVLISGELENYDAGKGDAAGAVAHITKPFKSGEFIEAVKRLAGEKKSPASAKGKKAAPSAGKSEEGLLETAPAVLELVERAPSEKGPGNDDELEIVDEDIDDLEADLDDLTPEEGEDADEELSVEEEGPVSTPADDAGSHEEVEAVSFALREPEEKSGETFDDIRISGDAGEVVSDAGDSFLPASADMGGATVKNEAGGEREKAAEGPPRSPAAKADDDFEAAFEALGLSGGGAEEKDDSGGLSRIIAEEAKAFSEEKAAPAGGVEEFWGKTLDEIDKVLEKTVEETAPGGHGPKAEAGGENLAEPSPLDGEKEEKPAAPPPVLGDRRMEALFREAAEAAVGRFMAGHAEAILREEVARAVETRVKEAFEQQFDTAIREEIGRVMAAGFQKAMPRMLAIIDKITVQITPRIAQHMIKIAIERIKKGDIN